MRMKIAFFDRDGTIALDYPDSEWTSIEKPVLMPYAVEALKHINDLGYQIIIITNQYIIGEGYITKEQFEDYNQKLLYILNEKGISILDVFHCPHSRLENCNCCKPKTGMIEKAVKKYPLINLSESFMVGDSLSDIKMAQALGLFAFGIGIDYNYNKYKRIENLKELTGVIQ